MPRLITEYILIHDEPKSAKIFLGEQQFGDLKNIGKGLYKLNDRNRNWLLNKRVDGEVRPFSIIVFKTEDDESGKAKEEILKIKDHIFLHNGYFYTIGGIPESRPPKEHLMGSKYICRMTNFPFRHPDQVDEETKSRMRKHRGVPVGEIFGLGSKGFHVKLEGDLAEIGLPLVASAYLMYSSV